MKNMKKLISEAVSIMGYTSCEIKIMGSIARVETNDGDTLDIYITVRKRQQMQDVAFSFSRDGMRLAEDCKCDYIAVLFGNISCCVVPVNAPDFVSRDEFSEKIYTYKNPLHDAQT